MLSFLDVIEWNRPKNETPVAPLSIDSPLGLLEQKAQRYFTIASGAVASDSNQLAITVNPKGGFDLNNAEHKALIAECLALFKEQSDKLVLLDQKIIYSALFGMVCASLSFLPFVIYGARLGWGTAVCHIPAQQKQFEEYQKTLNLLVALCNWSLGPKAAGNNKNQLIRDAGIRDMMAALYPVLFEKEIRHLVSDDIEDVFVRELHEYEHKNCLRKPGRSFFNTEAASDDERIAKGKRTADAYRYLYGHHKRRAGDYFDAFVSVFPDLYKMLLEQYNQVQHWWFQKNQETTSPLGMKSSA